MLGFPYSVGCGDSTPDDVREFRLPEIERKGVSQEGVKHEP